MKNKIVSKLKKIAPKKRKNKVSLGKLFKSLQDAMSQRLQVTKCNVNHPGTKGDASEICWLETFQNYLPKRYIAEKAHVLDSEGNSSDQIDIVIFDQQYSPFLLKQDNALYVPAESVYAIFEVKQKLSKQHIIYASNKAYSVRKLKRTSAPIYHIGGVNAPKPHFEILSGILTLNMDWKILGTAFETHIKKLKYDHRLDLGCVLEAGSFEVEYDMHKKFSQIITKEKDSAFLFFFFRLLEKLQLLGTVPAIELSKYAKYIK